MNFGSQTTKMQTWIPAQLPTGMTEREAYGDDGEEKLQCIFFTTVSNNRLPNRFPIDSPTDSRG